MRPKAARGTTSQVYNTGSGPKHRTVYDTGSSAKHRTVSVRSQPRYGLSASGALLKEFGLASDQGSNMWSPAGGMWERVRQCGMVW